MDNFWKVLALFMVIAIAILIYTIDLQEDRITTVEAEKANLAIENNKLKLQVQKKYNTDISIIQELERIMGEAA